MNKNYYRIFIPLVFKAGLSPGNGSKSNNVVISLNGNNDAVLRGSSIAGVLRSAFIKNNSEYVERWFGTDNRDKKDQFEVSRIKIADTILDHGKTEISQRTHNAINRHTGAAIKGGLFSIEALPPGTKATIIAEIDGRGIPKEECDTFIVTIANLFETGLFFGGNRNRGIGKATAPKGIFVEEYDLEKPDEYAALLDSRYLYDSKEIKLTGRNITVKKNNTEHFEIKLILGIPRGEDLLIGDGQTLDYVLEPQKTLTADGKKYWRIPGSTFRGIFKAWMSRLAAREGRQLRDDAEKFYNETNLITGENIGWGFVVNETERDDFKKTPDKLNDPIMSLFGSLYRRGRIHFADSFSISETNNTDSAERMHVSIDRFTGGANEGSLFKNKVLVNSHIEFPLFIQINSPKEHEIQWLVKTIKALHLGILSIGSSKSSGRLAVTRIESCNDQEKVGNLLFDFIEEQK